MTRRDNQEGMSMRTPKEIAEANARADKIEGMRTDFNRTVIAANARIARLQAECRAWRAWYARLANLDIVQDTSRGSLFSTMVDARDLVDYHNDLFTQPPARNGPKDWPEDAKHENGNYENRCAQCGSAFIGLKRRVTCRECAAPEPVKEGAD